MSKLIKCKTCEAEIAKNAKTCPSCGAKNKKPFHKKPWVWILAVIILIGSGSSCGDTTAPQDTTSEIITEEISEITTLDVFEEDTIIPDNNYMTSGSWALYDSNYMFAVEVDDFDGDIYKSGKYRFKVSAGRTAEASGNSQDVLPAIFDIYICDQSFSSSYEVTKTMSKPTISIGGMGSENTEIEHTLAKGQYVYIMPFEGDFKPSGFLTFEAIE